MLLFPFVRVLGSVGRVLFSSHALLSKHAIICFGLNMICNAQKGRKWSFSLQQEEHLPTEHLLVIIWRPPSARGQEANIWSRIQVTFASYLRVFSFALWKKKIRSSSCDGRASHPQFVLFHFHQRMEKSGDGSSCRTLSAGRGSSFFPWKQRKTLKVNPAGLDYLSSDVHITQFYLKWFSTKKCKSKETFKIQKHFITPTGEVLPSGGESFCLHEGNYSKYL